MLNAVDVTDELELVPEAEPELEPIPLDEPAVTVTPKPEEVWDEAGIVSLKISVRPNFISRHLGTYEVALTEDPDTAEPEDAADGVEDTEDDDDEETTAPIEKSGVDAKTSVMLLHTNRAFKIIRANAHQATYPTFTNSRV